jgi:hypothetical protein
MQSWPAGGPEGRRVQRRPINWQQLQEKAFFDPDFDELKEPSVNHGYWEVPRMPHFHDLAR